MLDSTALFIKDWLGQAPQERDINAAAAVLLRLNRNRILYGNIIGRPDKYADKLEYELRKYYRMYLDKVTAKDAARMDAEIMPKVTQVLHTDALDQNVADDGRLLPGFVETHPRSHFAGLRDDHNELPDHIRGLYEKNGDIYFRMKAIHGKLKTMANLQPCDRYELLKILDGLYKEYRENWNRYDNFDAAKEVEEEAAAVADSAQLARDFQAARKYISQNSRRIEAALANDDDEEAAKWVPKVQERIHFLLEHQQTFDADYQQKLTDMGFEF